MIRMRTLFPLLAAIASAAVFFSCGTPPFAGGTSETTNGFTAKVLTPNGEPVSNALVRLRPEGYLSDTGSGSIQFDSASVIDTFTDASGRFRITNIDSGSYCIEIQDGTGEGALLRSSVLKDSIIDCGVAVVEPAGNIRGYINRESVAESVAVYIRVYGMERVARAEPGSGAFSLHDMPQGDHSIYFVASSAMYHPKELHASVAPDSTSDMGKVSLFPFSGWTYSKVLSFNTTASGADITRDIYAFPILVRLNLGNFTFSQAKPNGEDIRFTKSDSTPVPYEIECWDATGGHAEIWVKIDTVFGNNDEQSITMYWGNTQATSLSKGSAVFDTTGGFQGVWHLGDESGDSVRDATLNRYHGVSPVISARPSIAEGIIGKCRSFDGTADFIAMPNTANSKLNFPQNGYYMVCAWVFLDTSDDASHLIVSKGYEQYYLRSTSLRSNSPLWEFVEFNESTKWQTSTFPATSGQWTFIAGVRQGKEQFLYCNGVLVDSTIASWVNVVSRNTSNDLSIGKFLKEVTVPINEGYCFFKGSIDEVRICSAACNPDWIKLCYMNQRTDDRLVILKK